MLDTDSFIEAFHTGTALFNISQSTSFYGHAVIKMINCFII